MRVLLVDDESAIRRGLRHLVDWGELGFRQVLEAGGAVEALELLRETPCDLMILDIFMPDISGMELARMVREEFPQTKFIILSGHEKFQLAREAMALGIGHYLLKPVLPRDLARAVGEVREEIVRERNVKDWMEIAKQKLGEYLLVVKNQFWDDLLAGRVTDPELLAVRGAELNISLGGRFCCVAIKVLQEEEGAWRAPAFPVCAAAREIVEEVLGGQLRYLLGAGGNLFQAVLDRDCALTLLERLDLSLQTNLGVDGFFGVGKVCDDPLELGESAESAREALCYTADRSLKVVRHRDVLLWKREQVRYPYGRERELLDWIRFQPRLDPALVESFVRAVYEAGPSGVHAKTILYQLLGALYRLSHEYGIQGLPDFGESWHTLAELVTLREITAFFVDLCDALVREKGISYHNAVVQLSRSAAEIIDREFSDPDLTVSVIAGRLGVTPNYLSRLFSGEMGATCTEYITQVRLGKAKELLLTTDQKSYRVAELVGYQNPNYFSSLFKKRFGVSPREMRQEQQNS